MKQFILTHKLLCILLACVIVAGATCAIVLPIALRHEHTFADAWTSDATNHWHAATCEHTDEKSGVEKHSFDDGLITTKPTETTKGTRTFTCTVCGYKKTEPMNELSHEHTYATAWTSDETNHWHAATCAHTDEKSGMAAHTFGEWTTKTEAGIHVNRVEERKCSVCEYTEERTISGTATHEYDYENIQSDAENHWYECSCGDMEELEAHTYGDWSEKTPAGEDQDKQYSRKCTVCQYEDVRTFENTKTNGKNYCVAITGVYVVKGVKFAYAQVLRGTIEVGDNIVFDGVGGTFTIEAITIAGEKAQSASCGQSVVLEISKESGNIDEISNQTVSGRLAYAPDTTRSYKTFTAQITIDKSHYSGNLNIGTKVDLDLYNVGCGLMQYSLVLPEGVTSAEDGRSYIVTVTLPKDASRVLWAGMEFTYRVIGDSDVIVATGVILSVAD